MSDLADFVLDFCRALGGVVEPPAYGVHEVLLPDAVALQLGIEPFQRFAFEESPARDSIVHLGYGHPLVERMAEVTRAAPACARFYVNDVRLDKSGLAALARAALSLPNAKLVEVPRALEARALFRYVRFNFKAALISDEKREQIVSVLMDVQTGASVPDFSASEAYRLADRPAFTELPPAAASWTTDPDPLSLDSIRALLDYAGHAAAAALAPELTALQARSERHLELDRARLEAYYADLERDLERRLERADDSSRRSNLESKLAATRADHAAKLADAETKYRPRLELDLVNLAVIAQPKLTLTMRVENRHAAVTRTVVWDPLRHVIESLVCEVCSTPNAKLFLCANNHLACEHCLAPQCVDCKRVYCRTCAHEVTTCVVCRRPVCQKSLTRCDECGQGTCREHAGRCHQKSEPAAVPAGGLPAEQPGASHGPVQQAPTPSPDAVAPSKPREGKAKPRPSKPKAPIIRPPPPAQATNYRLQVEIHSDEPLVVAFVLTKGDREVAQRAWQLSEDGIAVICICEKGWQCPWAAKTLEPESPTRIEAQLEGEINRFRGEYHIPPYRAAIYTQERGEFVRLLRLRLRGPWKDRALPKAAPAAPATQEAAPGAPPMRNPDWVLAFTSEEAHRFMPEIEGFLRIAYGWLFYEGALRAGELAVLTASVAHPGKWYSPERASTLFRASPTFRVARGNVVSIDFVDHPLKVLKEKEFGGLPPRAFTAEELLAAAEGPLPLGPREGEIERALNRHAARKLHLRSIQRLIRNSDRASALFSTLMDLCSPRDEPEANALLGMLGELWNNTPRYELRGRTPNEVRESF